MKILLPVLIIFFHNYCFGQLIPITGIDFSEVKSELYGSRKKKFKELCHKDSLRAVNDSRETNRYFIQIPALSPFDFHPSAELSSILKKHHIIWGGTWMGSDLPGSYSNSECYKSHSSKLTEQKFGKSFITKLIRKSVRHYQRNNPDMFFDGGIFLENFYKDVKIKIWDSGNQLNKDFFKDFKYPLEYLQFEAGEKEKSYSSVDIRINKNGKVVEILPTKHYFKNSLNKKHSLYFEKELIKFINKSKWSPSEYCGEPVNSIFTVQIFYN